MALYLFIIAVAVCLITALDVLIAAPLFDIGFWFIFGSVLLNVVAVIAVDGLFAFLIRRMPEKWFNHTKKIYTVSAKEKKFYEKLKIRSWKDKVPELGQFTAFHKNKIADPYNPKYLDRYFLELCYGEVIHIAGIILGFIIIAFYPAKYWLCFGFPVAVINAFLNFPSFCILRYNSYKLEVLYKSAERHKRRAEMKEKQKAEEQEAEKQVAVAEETREEEACEASA